MLCGRCYATSHSTYDYLLWYACQRRHWIIKPRTIISYNDAKKLCIRYSSNSSIQSFCSPFAEPDNVQIVNSFPSHLRLLRGARLFIDMPRLSCRDPDLWRTVARCYDAGIRFDTHLKINRLFPRITHLLVTLDVMRICSNSTDKVTCQQRRDSAVCVGVRFTSHWAECLHPCTSQSFSHRFYLEMDGASSFKKLAIVKVPNICILLFGQQGRLQLVAVVSIFLIMSKNDKV